MPRIDIYVDQDELPPHWGYGAIFTHCLDCGESKVDGHLDTIDGCPRACVRCKVSHNGTRCPKIYMIRAQWKRRGPRGKVPTLEERLAGVRLRPNEEEAAELVRRRYTMFENMYKRGSSSHKQPLDDDDSVASAPQKRMKLNDVADLEELTQAAAEHRNRLQHAIDEHALLQEDIAKARGKQAKADAVVALLADQLKQNRLAAEETSRLQRELEARRRIRDRLDKDTPSPGKETEQPIKREPSS